MVPLHQRPPTTVRRSAGMPTASHESSFSELMNPAACRHGEDGVVVLVHLGLEPWACKPYEVDELSPITVVGSLPGTKWGHPSGGDCCD